MDYQDVIQVCSTPSPCTSPKLTGFPLAPLLAEAHDPSGTEFMSPMRSSRRMSEPPSTSACQRLAPCPPPASPCNVAMLAQGTEVEIDGLLQRPDFNGLSGNVQSWDPLLRRYNVLLHSPPGSGIPRQVKTKRENLRIRPPPPPSATAYSATTIDLARCIPNGSEDCFVHGDCELVLMDAACLSPTATDTACMSPTMSPDDQAWYQWQYCDSMSPQGWHDTAKVEEDIDASPLSPTMESFVRADDSWEYNSSSMLAFGENSPTFDASMQTGCSSPCDGAGWMQQPLCDIAVDQCGW